MTRLSGKIRLRPTRIGFLVRPTDTASIRRIMRWSTCLWGGRSNPIIPVGPYPASSRNGAIVTHKSDRDVAREYMKFFEPDVLIEAEPGLATSIGYGALTGNDYETQLLGLDDLYSSNGDHPPNFRFGLSVVDAYMDIYQSERQFLLRDSTRTLIFNDTQLSPIVETVFGAFPCEVDAQDFAKSYDHVFRPDNVDLNVKHWFHLFAEGVVTPFVPTYHKIEVVPGGHRELSFFIFDHTKPTDLTDYWNTRLFQTPVYPVPLCWLEDLAPTMVDMITRYHRPIPNNPSGTKSWGKVYFGRSIQQDETVRLIRTHLADCPEGAFRPHGVSHPRVSSEGFAPNWERHTLEVDSASLDAELTDRKTIQFDTLAPGFAERYGGGRYRWVNVVTLSSFQRDTLALTYPSNLEDRTMPRHFGGPAAPLIIAREGWVLGQRFKGLPVWLNLSDGPTAIAEWLESKRINAELSDAGRNATQMIESLGSLRGSHLIADEETIRLLDRMATQEEVRDAANETTSRHYEGRTAQAREWQTLISRRAKNNLRRLTLDDFTTRGILKLGLAFACSNCTHANWFGLDDVSYEVMCERCLKAFPFPQGDTSARWKYRVTGAFSVPNFAQGAYCVVLTLNLFHLELMLSSEVGITYATGLNLTHERFQREIDFAFWCSNSSAFGQRGEPRFVFGEAKSFAREAVSDGDIEGLKLVAEAVPGSIIIVSVLKSTFSDAEKKRLVDFTRWGWETIDSRPRGQLLLLTGVELFSGLDVRMAWERVGAPYPEKTNYYMFHDLDAFARTTQKIHLGLDYYAVHP